MLEQMPTFPPLETDASADVCIVGAGIAGLTTAYLLARAGHKVIVLDARGIGGGESGRTTAHLSNAIDDRYFRIERYHGEHGAALCADSHTSAIDRIESIAREESIACDFERVDGYLFLGPDDESALLEKELEAARRAGLANVELFDRAPVVGFETGTCLRFPRQAQFHPLKYLAGLARAVDRLGGRIFGDTFVERICDGTPASVETAAHKVTAADIVVATNTTINDWFSIHTKQAPFRTYAIGARVPRGSVTHALFWDTCDPYHYVRLEPLTTDDGSADGDELLIVGGEDHKTGQDTDSIAVRHERLESWARDHFPAMKDVAFRWSGQVLEPVDGVAFIGRSPDEKHVYVATGDSGMGMTHGTIAGLLISDLLQGKDNRWTTLYDPGRVPLRAGGEYLKENLNVAAQYGAWLTGGDAPSEDSIPADMGAVIQHGLHKVAVYRDRDGRLRRHSAVCTHLGCVVTWNPTERSWDCPCHGSRFDPAGKVLNGPATMPLADPPDK